MPRRTLPAASRLRLVTLAAGVDISKETPSQRKDNGIKYGVPLAPSAVATQASTSCSSRCKVSCWRCCWVRGGSIVGKAPCGSKSMTALRPRPLLPSCASRSASTRSCHPERSEGLSTKGAYVRGSRESFARERLGWHKCVGSMLRRLQESGDIAVRVLDCCDQLTPTDVLDRLLCFRASLQEELQAGANVVNVPVADGPVIPLLWPWGRDQRADLPRRS